MHKCSKCGRAASSLEEIDAGCPCGSKVFVFDRQIAQAAMASGEAGEKCGEAGGLPGAESGPGNGGSGNPAVAGVGAPSTFAVVETAKDKAQEMPDGQEGKVPSSYYARSSFTNEDIENIKVLTQGIFLLDVNAISKNPVVLKDEDEIYYVKLPLVQKKSQSKEEEGTGKD